MKEHLFRSLLLGLFALAAADVPPAGSEDICRFFPNNTIIRDPDSCNKYITCIGFVSHYSECSGSTPLFDKDKGSCVKTLPEDSFCHVECTNFAGKFVPDPKSCRGYYYCHDEEFASPGKCPGDQHFHVEQQACVFKHESECAVEQFDFCALVKNGVSFRDEKFCHKYFTCTKGVQTSKTCSKKYYDPLKGSCEVKATVECSEHPLPNNVCGIDKKPKANYYAQDDATCAGYFYCAPTEDGLPDTNPKWSQCPPDTFFSVGKQACINPLDIKCDWDRCHGRTLTFVTSGKRGCRHYLRCRDGVTVQELSCGNLFFDEEKGVCTTDIINRIACRSK